jgi:hypothetical protein
VPAADPPAPHADLLAAPAADPPAPAADPPAPHADPPAPAADPPAPHADLPAPPAADPPAPAAHRPDPPAPDAPPNRYARGRARDAAIRRGLEPLAPGERPRAVTIAAIVAFVFAIANVVATLTVDDLSSGQNDPTLFAVVWTTVLVVAGAGMLARRYWAVLGFQCVLGLQIVVFSLAVTRVQKWWLAVAMTIAIGLMGWLFWKLIRPMARLQMPERPGSARS